MPNPIKRSTTPKTKISLFYLIKKFPFHFLLHYGFAALSAYGVQKLINWAIENFKSKNSANLVKAKFWPLLGGIMLYTLVVYCHIFLGIYCEEAFSSHLRKKLTQKLLTANFTQAQREKFLLTRYSNDAFNVGTLASRIYNRSFFAVVSIILVMKKIIENPSLTWVIPWCLGFLVIMGGSAALLYWLAYRYHLKRNERIEKEDKYFKELSGNLEYVKVVGAEKKETKKSNNLLENNLWKNTSFVYAKSTYATIPSYLLRHGIPLVFLYYYTGLEGAGLFMQMNQVFGDAKTVIEMFWAHGGYDTYCTSLKQLNNSFDTLEKKRIIEPKNINLQAPVIKKYDINFQEVNFSYSPEIKVLDNFSFNFQQGKKYAIIGPNGIGKSTIFKLILKLYQSESGEIKLGETNLLGIDSSLLTKKVFYLSNQSFFFNDTVANNIMYPDAYQKEKDHDKLVAVAKELGILELINKLPQGWETIIEEKGANLSEGQKQLISLARMFVNNHEVYLMDEILNNVNSEHRKKLLEIIFRKLKDKTIIFITHDKEDLRHAEEVCTFTNQKLIKN